MKKMTIKRRNKAQQKNNKKSSQERGHEKDQQKSEKILKPGISENAESWWKTHFWILIVAVAILAAVGTAVWRFQTHLQALQPTTQMTAGDDSSGPELSLEEKLAFYNVTYTLDRIDRRSNLSLQEYLDVYDAKWPVIVTDVVTKWPAFKKWSKEFFRKNYGEARITMKAVEGKMSKAEGLALPLHLFADHVHEGRPHVWTYLEDELFIKQRPELMKDIKEVIYLKEDFFQLFPEEVQPWNAMLLWGTAHSRSSLHIDPYNWTGTNAVLKGLKRWKLYPPGQDDYLYVFEDQRSGFPLECYKYNSPIDTQDVDWKKYPKFRQARAMEFDQYPGELLLIPTGWFHQAYNVEETMAISSQVMNRNNYDIVLHEIIKADNLQDQELPEGFETMSPHEQVKTVMSLLPEEILRTGREVTDSIIKQVAGAELHRQRLP